MGLPLMPRAGLRYWTVPHPEWEPDAEPESTGDWPSEVGWVLYEAPGATVFSDPERSQRVMQAMLSMRKIDIAALERAAAEE